MIKEAIKFRKVIVLLIGFVFLILPLQTSAQDNAKKILGKEKVVLIDINHASKEELITLTNIGPSRADAIIRYREKHPFQRIQQIIRIKGIGRATFRKIKSQIRVEKRKKNSGKKLVKRKK